MELISFAKDKAETACYGDLLVHCCEFPSQKSTEENKLPKVIITAQVQDGVKWEAGFRSHMETFRNYSIKAPIAFSINGNEVVICMEPEDMDTFNRAMESKETADA